MPFQKSVALKRLVVRDLLSVPNSCLSAFCRTLSWTKNGLRRFAIHRLGRKTGFGVLPNVALENLELRFSAVKINSQLPPPLTINHRSDFLR